MVQENVLDINLIKLKSRFSARYFFAVMNLSLLYFVTVVTYDCPGALQTNLMGDLSLSLFQFSQLMSSYSWSSVFSFVGGYLVDRWWGLNRGLTAFTAIFILGNALYTLAIFFNVFWLMIIGRLLAGLGGETLGALVSCYTLHWFSSGDLNLAFALSNSFSLLTPALVYQVAQPLYNLLQGSGSTTAIIFGVASTVAIICACVITGLHRKVVKDDGNKVNWNRRESFWSFGNFPKRYWILTGHVALVYTAMYNFVSLSQDYLVSWKGLSVISANNLISGYSFIMFATSPLIGILADWSGCNLTLLAFASVGSLSSHIILAFTQQHPTMPLVVLAVSMSVFVSSYSPLIGESVEAKHIATAYTLTYSLVNGCFGLGFLLVGFICEDYGYKVAQYYYISLLAGALGLLLIFSYLRRKDLTFNFTRILTEEKF